MGRYFTFIAYPKNTNSIFVDDDFQERIDSICSLHIPFVHSPIHHICDSDNKEHIHFIIRFQGNRKIEGVHALLKSVYPTCPLPLEVADVIIMERYLTHLDDPDKEQFSSGPICWYGYNLHYDKALQKEQLLEALFEFSSLELPLLMPSFMRFLYSNYRDLVPTAISCAYFINTMLKEFSNNDKFKL